MTECARAGLVALLLMLIACAINFRNFSANYIPAFIRGTVPKGVYPNESDFNRLINSEDYNLGEEPPPPLLHNYSAVRLHNASQAEYYINITYDYSRKPHRLWPTDRRCSKYTVRFVMHHQGAWLLSFPRSGNTWTRYLLEAASGIFTGSIYNSNYLKSLGYLGECDPVWQLSTLITKSHSLQPVVNHSQRPVVAIIRNPARSILSYWNYRNVEGTDKRLTGSIDKAFYATAGFHMFVREKLFKWRETYTYALKNITHLHVVFYEELRDHPLRETQRILHFLGVRTSKDRLFCLSRHLEGNAKGAQRSENPFTIGEKQAFEKLVHEINSLLIGRGLPPLPDYTRYDT